MGISSSSRLPSLAYLSRYSSFFKFFLLPTLSGVTDPISSVYISVMATANPSSSAAKVYPSRLCACGEMILSKDSHPLCIACLGVRHAQTALANPKCCPHCSLFPIRVLECRVRVTAVNKGDPRIYVPPVEKDEAAQLMHYNWGEFMDEI